MRFWWSWVVANALGEAVGLGTVFVIGVLVSKTVGEPSGAIGFAMLAILVILLAVFEGAVVGFAQWVVLRSRFGTIRAKHWIVATIVGAVIAWILGMIPSTLGALSQSEESVPVEAMPGPVVVFFAAAVMGLVLGVILATAQWWALRRHARRARWWLAANGLAWAAAMPMIFWFVGETIGETQTPGSVGLLVAGIGIAGAVVGAIHGIFIVNVIEPA